MNAKFYINEKLKIKERYFIVPWYSWKEWVEVYQGVSANDYESLKRSFDQISVWKSRMSEVSMGIEATIPLLQAKIAIADNSLDVTYKNPMVNLAILRFVTIVTEGFERNFRLEMQMKKIGFKMNLPHFLVNLRHEIVHKDNILGTSFTLKNALEVSLQWIKAHYWDKQYRRMNISSKEAKFEYSGSRRGQKRECDEILQSRTKTRKYNGYFDNAINLLTIGKYSHQKFDARLKKSRLLKKERIIDRKTRVSIFLSMFYSKSVLDFYWDGSKHFEKHEDCVCNCKMPRDMVRAFNSVFMHFMQMIFEDIFSVFKEIISMGKCEEMRELTTDWIFLIFNSSIFQDSSKCLIHHFDYKINLSRISKSMWKSVLYELFCVGSSWSSNLALDLGFKSKLLKAGEMDQLKELLKIYEGSKEIQNDCEARRKDEGLENKAVITLEDILSEVGERAPHLLTHCQNIAFSIRCDLHEENINTKKGAILGVLPHQKGDPYLYKKLII